MDHTTPLNGAMSAYQEHVLVCTGRDDWTSRIEDEHEGKNLAAYLKDKFFGRGGEANDPFHNVSVLNASFESTPPAAAASAEGSRSVYLLPSFKYVPHIREGQYEDVKSLVKGWVLPRTLSPMYEKTPEMKPEDPEKLLQDEGYRDRLQGVRDVDEILVLICGHGGRDERCGVFGPLLRGEFEEKLATLGGLVVNKGPKETDSSTNSHNEGIQQEDQPVTSARVGLISHIGGHKYAGNVILYLPPGMKLRTGERHPLAGMGIWYGRVEPKHVEGIIKETLERGNVIEEFYRGAINKDRKLLRLDLDDKVRKVKRSE